MSIKFWLFVAAFFLAAGADAQGFSMLGGVTKHGAPPDGTYWNANQPHDFKLTTPSVGIRWDSERMAYNTSFAVQYTYHGTAKTDALAVSVDAPHPGGYIQGSGGQCVGTCADLAQWKMRTRTQGVTFTGSKHWGKWSIEAGLNVYNTVTSGTVNYQNGTQYHYATHNYIGIGELFGVMYQDGDFFIQLRALFMDTPQRWAGNSRELAPSISNQDVTYSFMAGYKF